MHSAVLFDLDNTLIDRDRAFRECVDAAFSDPAVREELLDLDDGGQGDRGALLETWERHAGSTLTQSMLGKLIAGRLHPDRSLLDALHLLSASVKLGIITNGGSETQRCKIRSAGLNDIIPHNCVWVSEEVGMVKPNAWIFRLAMQSLEVAPENCIFIGDQERDDLAGAMAAGMRAHLVDGVLDGEQLDALMKQGSMR